MRPACSRVMRFDQIFFPQPGQSSAGRSMCIPEAIIQCNCSGTAIRYCVNSGWLWNDQGVVRRVLGTVSSPVGALAWAGR